MASGRRRARKRTAQWWDSLAVPPGPEDNLSSSEELGAVSSAAACTSVSSVIAALTSVGISELCASQLVASADTSVLAEIGRLIRLSDVPSAKDWLRTLCDQAAQQTLVSRERTLAAQLGNHVVVVEGNGDCLFACALMCFQDHAPPGDPVHSWSPSRLRLQVVSHMRNSVRAAHPQTIQLIDEAVIDAAGDSSQGPLFEMLLAAVGLVQSMRDAVGRDDIRYQYLDALESSSVFPGRAEVRGPGCCPPPPRCSLSSHTCEIDPHSLPSTHAPGAYARLDAVERNSYLRCMQHRPLLIGRRRWPTPSARGHCARYAADQRASAATALHCWAPLRFVEAAGTPPPQP